MAFGSQRWPFRKRDFDGFWIHRSLLIANGIQGPGRRCGFDRGRPTASARAKTNSIDGETLLRTMMAWAGGERRVCSMVRASSPEDEGSPAADARARHAAQGTHSAHQSGQRPVSG